MVFDGAWCSTVSRLDAPAVLSTGWIAGSNKDQPSNRSVDGGTKQVAEAGQRGTRKVALGRPAAEILPPYRPCVTLTRH